MHVASSRRSCEVEAKDGRFDGVAGAGGQVGPSYPFVAVVFYLGHRGIVVFCFYVKIRTTGCCGRLPSATLSHPHRVRVSFNFGEVREVLHARRESGVSVLDLHQKWENEGGS